MTRTCLIALLSLAACATAPGGLPRLHYADAASRGAFASFMAGRPKQAQVDRVTQNWSDALGDSFACGVRMRDVLNAGLAGALEIGAMNAAASGGGEREVREGVGRYVGQIASLALARRERPSADRCEKLNAWAPQTAEAGRDAVARARRNGLMDEDYGILLDLMSR
jgi:hypothetical protein